MTSTNTREGVAVLLALAFAFAAVRAQPMPEASVQAEALARREAAMEATPPQWPFRRVLHIDSIESNDTASGDVYARLPHAFAVVASGLARPQQWCEVLILHLNVKHCAADVASLTVYLGSKREQPLTRTFPLHLAHEVVANGPAYLQVRMQADKGPLGTRAYRITLEAIPSGDGRSFMHLRYAVGYGLVARLTMTGYLGTVARDKIGFTLVKGADGTTRPVSGRRAAIERNAMRYALAVGVYLDSMGLPPAAAAEERLTDWFDATERYAEQLHEIDRAEYLAMKHHELARITPDTVNRPSK